MKGINHIECYKNILQLYIEKSLVTVGMTTPNFLVLFPMFYEVYIAIGQFIFTIYGAQYVTRALVVFVKKILLYQLSSLASRTTVSYFEQIREYWLGINADPIIRSLNHLIYFTVG